MAAPVPSKYRRFEGSQEHCHAVECIANVLGIENKYWVDHNTSVVTYYYDEDKDARLWKMYREWLNAGAPDKQEQILERWAA